MSKSIKIFFSAIFITLLLLGTSSCSNKLSSGSARGSNVIIIVLDTLRADHLGCYGYFRDTSPGIDALSRECMVFDDAFCSIPITFPSHTSILTGLYPQQSGVVRNQGRLDDNITTLAEILFGQGYHTAAVVSTAVLKKQKNLSQGFEAYLHNWGISDLIPPGGDDVWKIKGLAEDANKLALKWLEENSHEPFFLFINYYDVHFPFIEHEKFQNYFNNDTSSLIAYLAKTYSHIPKPKWKLDKISRYDRALRYLDQHLSQLIQKLKEDGLLDETILIITSDHGNGLYQHLGYWSHGQLLYDEQIHIPLLIRLPSGERSGRVSGQVETVDIFSTVLDLLGLQSPGQVDGVSFLPLMTEEAGAGKDPIYAMRVLEDAQGNSNPNQFAVRSSREKLIHTIRGEDSFFNLESDPHELNNRWDEQTGRQSSNWKSLRNQGLKWYQLNRIKRNKPGPMDAETLKELKALGYITQ